MPPADRRGEEHSWRGRAGVRHELQAPGPVGLQLAQLEALRGLRHYGAAEALLVEGCSGVLGNSEPSNVEKRRAVEHLVALYDAWGKPEKAAEWRTKLTDATAKKAP